MADFGSQIDAPLSKKKKWTDTGLTVFVSLIVAFFLLVVLSNGFQLFFQHSLFKK